MTGEDPTRRWDAGSSSYRARTWEGSWTDSIRAALHPAGDHLPGRVTVLTSYTWTDPAALRTAGQILTDAADALAHQQATDADTADEDDEQPTLWETVA